MGAVHMVLGILLIILMLAATQVELVRGTGVPRGLRGATIGLLDLQVLLGIITWIVVKPHGFFILHPILMVVAVVVAHIFTNGKKPRRTRINGWIIADVLLILGALLTL